MTIDDDRDVDRAGERALERLVADVGSGALGFEEFERRSEAVAAARTVDGVWAAAGWPRHPGQARDLVRTDRPAPVPAVRPRRVDLATLHGRALSAEVRAWAVVGAINLVIWAVLAVAVGPVYFWPMWVIGPWGLVLLSRRVLVPVGGRACRA